MPLSDDTKKFLEGLTEEEETTQQAPPPETTAPPPEEPQLPSPEDYITTPETGTTVSNKGWVHGTWRPPTYEEVMPPEEVIEIPEINVPSIDLLSEWASPTTTYIKNIDMIPTSLVGSTVKLEHSSLYPKWMTESVEPGYGIPDTWDYRTATVDPMGNPLPEGAISFDPNGNPWYGEGWKGVWNKLKSTWDDVLWGTTVNDVRMKYGLNTEEAKEYIAKEEFGYDAFNYVLLKKGHGGAINYLWDMASTRSDLMRKTTAIGQSIFTIGFQVANFFSRDLIERPLGTITGTIEDLSSYKPYEESFASKFDMALKLQQATKDGQGILNDAAYALSSLITELNPGQIGYNLAGMAVNAMDKIDPIAAFAEYDYTSLPPEMTKENFIQTVKENWEASRFSYSWFGNETVKQEYIRRFREGEYTDPALLAMEYEKPWAESAGQMIADPLNFLDFVLKGFMNAKRLAKVQDTLLPGKAFDDLIDTVRYIPGEQLGDDVLNAMTDVTMAEAKRVQDGIRKSGESYKIWDYAHSAKQFQTERNIVDLTSFIGASGKEDDLSEGLRILALLASDDRDDVMQGVAMAGKMATPRVYFSDAAFETGTVLRKMMENSEGAVDFTVLLDGLAKHREAISAAAQAGDAKKLGAAYDDLVNWIGDKTKKALNSIYPAPLDNPNGSMISKVFSKAHKVAQRNLGIETANSIFGAIYMGMSPGFAFRNAAANTIQILVDEGIGAFARSPRKQLLDISEWLKGPIPFDTVMGYGVESGSRIQDAFETASFRGYWDALKGGKDLPAKEKFGRAWSRAAEFAEQQASIRVVSHAVEQTMSRAIKYGRALPAEDILRAAGYSDEALSAITQLTYTYKGDVEKAVTEIVKDLVGGAIPGHKSLSIFDERQLSFIDEYLGTGTQTGREFMMDVLQRDNVDEALDMLDESFERLQLHARQVEFEHAAADNVVPTSLQSLVDDGTVTREDAQNLINASSTNSVAMKQIRSASMKAYKNALEKAGGNKEVLDALENLFAKYENDLIGGGLTDIAYTKSKTAVDEALEVRDFFRMKDEEGLWNFNKYDTAQTWWEKAPFLTGDAPQDLTKANFWDYTWEALGFEGEKPPNFNFSHVMDYMWAVKTKPTQMAAWQITRDTMFSKLLSFTDEASALAGLDLRTQPYMKEAIDLMATARLMDNSVIIGERTRDIAFRMSKCKNNAEALRLLFNQYGVATASETGAVFDTWMLNILKKYGDNIPDDLKKLKDVDLIAGWRALDNWREAHGYPIAFPGLEKFFDDYSNVRWGNLDEAGKMSFVENALLDDIAPLSSPYLRDPEWEFTSVLSNERDFAWFDLPDEVEEIPEGLTKVDVDILGDTHYIVVREGEEGMAETYARYIEQNLQIEDPKLSARAMGELLGYPEEDIQSYMNRLDAIDELDRTGLPPLSEIDDDVMRRAREMFDEVNPGLTDEAYDYSQIAYKMFGESFPVVPAYNGGTVTSPRMLWEQLGGIEQELIKIKDGIASKWGKYVPTNLTPADQQNLMEAANKFLHGYWDDAGKYVQGAVERMSEARLLAARVGELARKFTLHSYPEKRNLDLVLSYIYPYQFWYSRTYTKWLTERVVRNPGVIAAYMQYREALVQEHANAPEWWKYNISTNELLGMDAKNPLLFALEATLNPMNGLTGVNFNDPNKRVNWLTTMVDNANTWGPSMFTPFQWGIALSLYIQGQYNAQIEWRDRIYSSDDYTEAARRWAGRLMPLSRGVKAATSFFIDRTAPGVLGKVIQAGGIEIDPMIWLTGGDPYEENRIERALGDIIMADPTISAADIIDAANEHSGPLWDMAHDKAASMRAFGQITSFLFGVGFKARNPEDMLIDKFHEEYYQFWNQVAPNLSPDEVSRGIELMRQKWGPMMDTIILSHKGGSARDRTFTYGVLARIPPGMTHDLMKATTDGGELAGELLNKFYEDKGNMSAWNKDDKDAFMLAINTIASLLEVPDDATRVDFQTAKDTYGNIMLAGEELFGDMLFVKEDYYWHLNEIDHAGAREYLEGVPELEQWWDFKREQILRDPLLMKYYGSIETVNQYYVGEMWADVENQLGEDIYDKWGEYHDLEGMQSPAAILWDENPFFEEYMAYSNWYDERKQLIYDQLEQELPGYDAAKDLYYSTEDKTERRYIWNTNPVLEDYQNRKDELFEQYLNGYQSFEQFWRGEDLWNKDYVKKMWDLYEKEKEKGGNPQQEYWEENPELGKYIILRDEWKNYINETLALVVNHIPEAYSPEVRTDRPEMQGGYSVLEAIEPQAPTLTKTQWEMVLDPSLVDLIINDNIPEKAYPTLLEYYANMFNISVDALIIGVKNSEVEE